MRKEDKAQIIDQLVAQLEATPNFYVADIAGLNAENTTELRRACFEKGIKLVVVKNTLFVKALDRLNVAEAANITPSLKGSSAVMFTETPNAPAKLIKEFGAKMGKPALKSAFLQECAYVGAQHLEDLVNIKSREELIGDIIGL